MQKIRIKFEKGPSVKFISHLDMMRAFERAIRRTDIPIAYSSGFNPRPRISWGPPLAIGIESDHEFADLNLDGWIKPDELSVKLNKVLPRGFQIIEAIIAPSKEASLDSLLNRAEYIIEIETGQKDGLRSRLEQITKMDRIEVEKKGKLVDKRPMLFGLQLTEEPLQLRMTVQVGGKGTLKPKEILDLIEDIDVKSVKRTKLYSATTTSTV
jgi:radical SAM-linked protein